MTSLATEALAPQVQDLELSEEYLAQRFMRPAKPSEKISYEFTQDIALLHQYYRLRAEQESRFDGFDDRSQILVAKRGRQCIAGVRFTPSAAPHAKPLPMEGKDLSLQVMFPELNLTECSYGEASCLAILPDYPTETVFTEIVRHLIKKVITQKVKYLFSLSPQPVARAYRDAAQLFGLKWDVRNDIEVPNREEYEGGQMVLSVMDLAPYVQRHTPAYQSEKRREPELAD